MRKAYKPSKIKASWIMLFKADRSIPDEKLKPSATADASDQIDHVKEIVPRIATIYSARYFQASLASGKVVSYFSILFIR
jgi:hypothetical protein